MRKKALRILFCISLSYLSTPYLLAESTPKKELTHPTTDSFTGEITGNRVRLRLFPNLDSGVLHELKKGELVVVTGEENDFYAILPPPKIKAYIYRTYVLDQIVEADSVNVRLAPRTESPIIAQLNMGDKIEGQVCPQNKKWLEIKPPSFVRFYIAKNYIQYVGDKNYLFQIEKRKDEVKGLLEATLEQIKVEGKKPYDEIPQKTILHALEHIIDHYSDFPQEKQIAEKALATFQELLLKKKMAYLENETARKASHWSQKNIAFQKELQQYQSQLNQLENEIKKVEDTFVSEESSLENKAEALSHLTQNTAIDTEHLDVLLSITDPMTEEMKEWQERENNFYQAWLHSHPNESKQAFYYWEASQGKTLQGLILPYTKPVHNRPGAFILKSKNRPIAYLYSTRINLQNKLGKEVKVVVAPRPNNHFAYPAYHVIAIE